MLRGVPGGGRDRPVDRGGRQDTAHGGPAMGFLNGRVTYTRYRVSGDSPLPFGEDLLEQAAQHAIGRHGARRPDRRRLRRLGRRRPRARPDLRPRQEHHQRRPPPGHPGRYRQDPRLAAAGVHADRDRRPRRVNPSGLPTKAQRDEAKEAARIRAEAEAADGRFRRLAHYPVLWDGRANILYAGATSNGGARTAPEPLPRDLRPRPSSRSPPAASPRASPTPRGEAGAVEEFGPVGFVERGRQLHLRRLGRRRPVQPDFWGNEFLIWLWHTLQNDGDTLDACPTARRPTVMLAKTLTLDCPRGETGRDCLTNEGPDPPPRGLPRPPGGQAPPQGRPDRRPARPAVRADPPGRDAGGLGRQPAQARGGSGHELHVARIDSLRHLVETLDLLYDAYGRRRTGPEWSESSAASAAGSRRREDSRRTALGSLDRSASAGCVRPRLNTDLGNYRQHVTFAGVLGVGYAWAAIVLAGIHWVYGSVAALLPRSAASSRPRLRLGRRAQGVHRASSACSPRVAVWQKIGQHQAPAGVRVPPVGGRPRVHPRCGTACGGHEPDRGAPGDQPQPPHVRRLGGARLSLLPRRATTSCGS